MEFGSILDLRESPYKGDIRAGFFIDLNINQIIDSIKQLWGTDVSAFYNYLPADKECEDYRRAVMGDVKRGELYLALLAFVKRMKVRDEALASKETVRMNVQKAAWHIKEVVQYGEALLALLKALEETDICSTGMMALRTYLQQYLTSPDFVEMYEQSKALLSELQGFRFKLTYENNLIILTEEEAEGTYEGFLQDCFPAQDVERKSPFGTSPELNALEQELLRIVQGKKPAFFKSCEAFYQKYEVYAKEELLRFAEEITYYLAFYKFEQKMQQLGFAFTTPTIEEDREMFATGLYDLALACVNCKEQKEVVSNDMVYHAGESFFVVTGPNQGGKTTFARSLGQLLYFCKMGLDVPALAANVHYFTHILTHFSVEESVETGRGKLQEELVRLQPMMAANCKNAFVIINELFTTAANYDACIMGQKVLRHFIQQQCFGIYVTHLKELTQAHESVVSMCATLDEHGIQNHKIVRKEAGDVACAINQVNKYRLTYAQLKERLS